MRNVQEDQAHSTPDPECLCFLLLAQALLAERAARPGEVSAMLPQCLGRGVAAGRHLLRPSVARLALAAGDHSLARARAP